ncbi:contractile injection system protein, VgrG/Pvc8 family [Acinetobacter guillouiae]|uniref:contractile injection system protein, VgrG/Pvc8 family n=1 Tax=Acinetobacter guillouiae TaxID=106649 RepID=UPI001AE4B123|nr:contractile injection system protein, VgrG/Pvc8 family [Acinetobacter guillouiae]MBP2544667.1 phage protein D [Acinetobacter guillouiae]
MIKTPTCLITADNKPLNDLIQSRIISVTVTDNRANEADELSIVLDDSDGILELPKRGVRLNCKMGFIGEELHDKGDFIVDETEWSGSPDQITVKASSANFKSNLKVAQSKSYHRKTFGEVATEIARKHALELVMTATLKSINLNHIDQTNESDLNLLARLAKQNGAEMAVKKDRLLIFQAGTAKSASGQNLPSITLTRNDGDQFRYNEQDRESDYTGVSASYQDLGKATRKRVTSGNPEKRGGGNDPTTKTKIIKGTFASKEEAQRATDAKMAEIKRQMAKFGITTAYGIPEISTESPVKLNGFKCEVDKLKWIVEKATHSYARSGGLTTQLDLEANIN